MAGTSLEESRLLEFGLPPGHSVQEKELLSELGLSSDHRARVKAKDLSGYNLQGALFIHANLSGFDLTRTNLQKAILIGVDLQRALLEEANLKGANLGNQTDYPGGGGISLSYGSNLQDANLRNAILEGANLHRVNLKDTIFHGADLSGVKYLTQEQIDQACIDEQTKLPLNLNRPEPCQVSERE